MMIVTEKNNSILKMQEMKLKSNVKRQQEQAKFWTQVTAYFFVTC